MNILLIQIYFLRVPWTARRSNQSFLKEISPRCSLEGLMLKLKLQYFGHLMPSKHLILSSPSPLPPIPPSIRVFSNESTLCVRWPKYWSFSFSISPSKENPGLISFRMDWLDLLAVQGTLKKTIIDHQILESFKSIFLLQNVSGKNSRGAR